MTQETINEALECGINENSPDETIVGDKNGNVDYNKFECDDIKGVCGGDVQHNLNPQNKNDDHAN